MTAVRAVRQISMAGAVALFALAGAAPLRADYKESYRKGMEAKDRGNWAEVARLMRQAAAEQPKEGESVKIYGMRFETYLPSYYLGLALFNTGDCDGAVTAWQASVGSGAVQKTGEFKTLNRHKATCETRMAQARPQGKAPTPAGPDPAVIAEAVKAAEAGIAQAEQQAAGVSALQSDPALSGAWSGDAALGGAQKTAADLLATARARLESGRRKPDLGEIQQAQEMAARADQQFEGLHRVASARRDAARAAQAKPSAAPPTLAATPSRTGPPPELLRAASAYFAGNYREAAAVLSTVSYPGGRAAAQAMLLRAAARHALFVLSGEQDQALATSARADVKACRGYDAGFAPDTRFFSPRFTDFFKGVR